MDDSDTYDIVDDGPSSMPALPGRAMVFDNSSDLIDAICGQLAQIAADSVNHRGSFQLILSPTGLTTRMIRSMLIEPAFRSFPWARTDVWLAVVELRGDSNHGADIAEMLINHGGLTPDRFHEFDGQDVEGAQACGRRFREYVTRRGTDSGADCALIALDCGWFESAVELPEEADVYGRCPRTGRHVLIPSRLHSCTTIIAAGTMRLVENNRSAADRFFPSHPGLCWSLSRSEAEESR